MTDVVYILADKNKRGSEKELKLSLRSLEENCKDLGNVYIVTDKLPRWIKNVNLIKCKDLWKDKPEKNVFLKIICGCLSEISDDFLFMNDDFFLTEPFIASEYPYYFNGYLDIIENPSNWQQVQNNSINHLKGKGIKKIKNFCVHHPILYNKNEFIFNFMGLHLSIPSEERGYNHKILYGNLFSNHDVFKGDCKVWNMEQFYNNYKSGCISTPEEAKEFLDILEIIFNKKSRFEK